MLPHFYLRNFGHVLSRIDFHFSSADIDYSWLVNPFKCIFLFENISNKELKVSYDRSPVFIGDFPREIVNRME